MSEEGQQETAPQESVTTAPKTSVTSLAEMVTTEETQGQAGGEQAPKDWFWADDIQGQGDRPEWLQDRYKTVSEQAKAYKDLESKFGQFKGAPKDGYNLEKVEGIDKESPLLGHFKDVFKDLNLSQEGFERVVNEFVNAHESIISTDAEAEMKKLGPHGKQILQQTVMQVQNNFPKEVADTIKSWMMTAQDVEAVKTMMSYLPQSRAPSNYDMQPAQQFESYKELLNEKATQYDKYMNDANYRNRLDEKIVQARRRESNERTLQRK